MTGHLSSCMWNLRFWGINYLGFWCEQLYHLLIVTLRFFLSMLHDLFTESPLRVAFVLKGQGYCFWHQQKEKHMPPAGASPAPRQRAGGGRTGLLVGLPGGPHWRRGPGSGDQPEISRVSLELGAGPESQDGAPGEIQGEGVGSSQPAPAWGHVYHGPQAQC